MRSSANVISVPPFFVVSGFCVKLFVSREWDCSGRGLAKHTDKRREWGRRREGE